MQFFRDIPTKLRPDRRSHQYPKGFRFGQNWLDSARWTYLRLRPTLKSKYIKEMRFWRQATYSMEASMMIALYVLNAADHARRTGEIRAFDLCLLDGGPMISVSVR